jgi:pSer/pThr/pTyr-binding forkhead associated (FHA) protein
LGVGQPSVLMKVVLEVDKGTNQGTRYEIDVRCYRAVGRAGSVGEITIDLSEAGERVLDPDDLKRVEQHLAKRSPGKIESQDKLRIGAFRRGHDILLADEKVSKTHAMIFMDEDGPSIVDLLSTNGTHVNGQKVSDADLHNGDIINIGKTRFVVRLE